MAAFDEDHRHLADLMNNVHATLQQTRDHGVARGLLVNLIVETQAHFTHEERTLQQAGYPNLRAHAAEHNALIATAWEMVARFDRLEMSALGLPTFIRNWLIPHIQTADRHSALTMKRAIR